MPVSSKIRPIAVRLAIIAQMSALSVGCGLQRTDPHGGLSAMAAALAAAPDFAVLAGSTVTNTGPTVVSGNLGVSPGSAVTGFPPGLVIDGTIHAADAVAGQAQSDDSHDYQLLAGEACNNDLTGHDLAGLTLVAGVYCYSSSAQLSGALTLDAQGDPNAIFIFQIGTTLTTGSHASVLLINGAQGCNVFWQVGSSATIGTGTSFVGSIFALTSITLTTGASLSGRALAQNGAVTMDDNLVSLAVCASPTDGGGSGSSGSGGSSSSGGGSSGSSGSSGGGGGCCAGSTKCGTACVDLQGAHDNCGSCGTACGANETCQFGGCTTCEKNLCGNQCVDLVSDPKNCGVCENVCAPGEPCTGGYCGRCPGAVCGSWCVDLQTDLNNCGRCGNACGPDEICLQGSCSCP